MNLLKGVLNVTVEMDIKLHNLKPNPNVLMIRWTDLKNMYAILSERCLWTVYQHSSI